MKHVTKCCLSHVQCMAEQRAGWIKSQFKEDNEELVLLR